MREKESRTEKNRAEPTKPGSEEDNTEKSGPSRIAKKKKTRQQRRENRAAKTEGGGGGYEDGAEKKAKQRR